MDRLSTIVSEVSEAAGRVGGVAGETLRDRLELLALELREAKIRLLQFLLLVCMGVVFSLLGLVLLVLTAIFVLPPQWRLYGFAAAAVLSLLAGALAFGALRRRLSSPVAFDQTVAELQKDAACFSTRN